MAGEIDAAMRRFDKRKAAAVGAIKVLRGSSRVTREAYLRTFSGLDLDPGEIDEARNRVATSFLAAAKQGADPIGQGVKQAEIALLATIRGAECPTEAQLETLVGHSVQATLAALSSSGFIDQGHWSHYRGRALDETDTWRYTLSAAGAIALKVIDGRTCDWCHRRAIEGRELKRGGTYIWFCRHHFDIGWESAETEPSSRGSLHGLIRAGKIKPREPDEVAT